MKYRKFLHFSFKKIHEVRLFVFFFPFGTQIFFPGPGFMIDNTHFPYTVRWQMGFVSVPYFKFAGTIIIYAFPQFIFTSPCAAQQKIVFSATVHNNKSEIINVFKIFVSIVNALLGIFNVLLRNFSRITGQVIPFEFCFSNGKNSFWLCIFGRIGRCFHTNYLLKLIMVSGDKTGIKNF